MATPAELQMRLDNLASEMITDRTEEDAAEMKRLRSIRFQDMTAEEKIAINDQNAKGTYTVNTINRVSEFCNVFAEFVAELGYPISDYAAIRTNWVENQNITLNDLTAYTEAIKKIQNNWAREIFDVPSDISHGLSVFQANEIERMLIHCLEMAKMIINSLVFSGEFRSKE